MIGLNYSGRAVMGMMSQPHTGERFWLDGTHSYASSFYRVEPLRTCINNTLSEAILHTTSSLNSDHKYAHQFDLLCNQTRMMRYGGECYAVAMPAARYIDICVEFSLQPYDIVALIFIIENAGGVVTTVSGDRAESGGVVISTGNPTSHEKVLKILQV